MRASTLLWKRWLDNARFQVRAWRMGIDWTVLLYIVIPAISFVVYVYRSWWIAPPVWMTQLPFPGFLLLIYIYTWIGSLRMFLEEADQLFLLQKRSFYLSFRRLGIFYSLGKSLFGVIFILILSLPYLTLQTTSIGEILFLFLMLALWKMVFLLVKHSLFLLVARRFIQSFILAVLFFISLPIYFFGFARSSLAATLTIILGLCAAIALLFRLKAMAVSHFHEEVVKEVETRYKVVSLFLMRSGTVDVQKSKQRRRPSVFRRSNQWFKNRNLPNVVFEHFVKAWLRKWQNIFDYIRFFSISIVALLLFPTGWNKLILLIVMFLFHQMVKHEWLAYEQSSFFQLYAREKEAYRLAEQRMYSVFLFPSYVAIITIQGALSSELWLTLLLIAVVTFFSLKPWLQSTET